MKTLAETIKALRGDRNYVQFAEFTGVNRQSLADVEAGESVRLSTLKRIAVASRLDEAEWVDLLMCWIRTELGEEAHLLEIHPAKLEAGRLVAPKGEVNVSELLSQLFSLCSTEQQEHILKALARPQVTSAIKALNQLWEAQSLPSGRETPPTGQLAGLAERLAKSWPTIRIHEGECSMGLIATLPQARSEEGSSLHGTPAESIRSRHHSRKGKDLEGK